MANGTSIGIPGLSFGGAFQVSNTGILTLALASVAATLVGCHIMNGMRKNKHRKKEWARHSPDAIENKVMHDVVAFASNVHSVANNLPQVRNMVHRLRERISDQIASYRRGEITAAQFDGSVRNMYQLVLDEMEIPANTVPQHVTSQIDAMIDRVAEKILSGNLPIKVNFRMYKTHPGLAQVHELGRERAIQMGLGNKFGLKRKMAMNTNAGVYLKDVGTGTTGTSSNFGWTRPGGSESYYGWTRQWY